MPAMQEPFRFTLQRSVFVRKRVIQVFTLAVVLLTLAALTSSSVFAAPASHTSPSVTNPYSPMYGHNYRHGAVPTISQLHKINAYQQTHPNVTGPNTISYGGGIDGIGVTSGTEKVYLVFYGTQWGSQSTDGNGNLTFSNDSSGAAPHQQQFFKGVGTGNEAWSGTMTQ
jgi:serine protease